MNLDDNLEATNFYNIEVIANDQQNFIIKKNSIFNKHPWDVLTYLLMRNA